MSSSSLTPDPANFTPSKIRDADKYSTTSAQAVYSSSKSGYAKDKVLDNQDTLKIIEKYNKGDICLFAACNDKKILLETLRKTIKLAGFRWDIASKSFVVKTLLRRRKQKKAIRTVLKNVSLDQTAYRILMLKVITEEKSSSILINQLIINSATNEMLKLSRNSVVFNSRSRVLEVSSSPSAENPT
jgi:hypothetical protein